jgi:hypothetical protein
MFCFMVVRNMILIEGPVSRKKEKISIENLSFLGLYMIIKYLILEDHKMRTRY